MSERKQKRGRLDQLIDRADELADTPGTAVSKAVQQGILERTDPNLVFDARHYFVMKLVPLPQISRKLNVPLSHLERWAMLFGWHDLRRRREEHLYRAMGGRMEAVAKTLGVRSDEIASNLEGAVEEILMNRRVDGDELSPKDLGVLTKALKDIYELRRTIHGREGKVDRKIVEHQVNAPDDIKALLQTMRQEPTKQVKADVIEDAEYEIIE